MAERVEQDRVEHLASLPPLRDSGDEKIMLAADLLDARRERDELAREVEHFQDWLDREVACNEANCKDARLHREARERAEREVERLREVIESCPGCQEGNGLRDRAEKAERELAEARKAADWLWDHRDRVEIAPDSVAEVVVAYRRREEANDGK